jgi:hypothetical protein
VHWNTMHMLRPLGGSDTSKWHGQGGVYGRSRAGLVWGIDSSGRGKPGGEVTGQEMDGGVPTMRGCPRWPWRRPGQPGVLAPCHCKVGLALGFLQGGDHLLGVEGGGLVED